MYGTITLRALKADFYDTSMHTVGHHPQHNITENTNLYCKFRIGTRKFKTSVANHCGHFPKWPESFNVVINYPPIETIRVEVWENKLLNKFVAGGTLNVQTLFGSGSMTGWFHLMNSSQVFGKVLLDLHFVPGKVLNPPVQVHTLENIGSLKDEDYNVLPNQLQGLNSQPGNPGLISTKQSIQHGIFPTSTNMNLMSQSQPNNSSLVQTSLATRSNTDVVTQSQNLPPQKQSITQDNKNVVDQTQTTSQKKYAYDQSMNMHPGVDTEQSVSPRKDQTQTTSQQKYAKDQSLNMHPGVDTETSVSPRNQDLSLNNQSFLQQNQRTSMNPHNQSLLAQSQSYLPTSQNALPTSLNALPQQNELSSQDMNAWSQNQNIYPQSQNPISQTHSILKSKFEDRVPLNQNLSPQNQNVWSGSQSTAPYSTEYRTVDSTLSNANTQSQYPYTINSNLLPNSVMTNY